MLVCVCVLFQYCHYVAGLVGIGLSRLFSASKLEDDMVGKDHKLANSMGLFLQKTNIIRDYLEDTKQSRHFWPKQVHLLPLYILAHPCGMFSQWSSDSECFHSVLLSFSEQNTLPFI